MSRELLARLAPYDWDAVPEHIDDKETAPVEYCEACGCPEDDGKPCVAGMQEGRR